MYSQDIFHIFLKYFYFAISYWKKQHLRHFWPRCHFGYCCVLVVW